MKLYRETHSARLEEIEYRMDLFTREVDAGDSELNMHEFFVTNRNIIFGQYLYLLHEIELSSESFIDFIAFTENGAVLLIEVKRGADSRNRQEVVSQLGKYAIDAFAINNLIEDEEALVKSLSDPKLLNKPIDNFLLIVHHNNLTIDYSLHKILFVRSFDEIENYLEVPGNHTPRNPQATEIERRGLHRMEDRRQKSCGRTCQ